MAHLLAAGGHRKEIKPSGDLIGSAEHADIRVSADLGLAEQHFRVGLTPAGWQVQPLAPLSLNGAEITDLTPLSHGDQISAGGLSLVFEAETAEITVDEMVAAETETQPVAAAGIQDLSAAIAGAKEKKQKRKLPKLVIPAAAALVLAGGAFAAWKTGILPFGKGSSDPHFDLLSEHAPAGSDFAVSIDVQGVGEFYELWRPKLAPEAPTIAQANEQMTAAAGLRFDQFERISLAGRSDAATAISSTGGVKSGIVLLLSLSEGTDAATILATKIPGVQKTESPDGYTLYQSPMNDDLAARVVDGRHILLASPEDHARTNKAENPYVAKLQASGKTLAISGKVPAADQFRGMADDQALPTSIDLDVDLPAGIDVAIGLNFANEADAAKVESQLSQLLAMAGGQIEQALEGDTALQAKAVLARIEMAREGARQTIGLRFTEGELAMAAKQSLGQMTAQAERSNSIRNAQNLASVYATAMAAGSTGFEAATTKEEIAQHLMSGVRGSKDAGFGETVFQVASMSEDDVEAALEFIDDQFDYIHIPSPSSSGSGLADNMLKGLFKNIGSSDNGKAARNAQNLASVYSSARAAGSPALENATDAESAARMLIEGVQGSENFDTTTFRVPLSDNDLAEALEHLSWDGGLTYAPQR